MTTTPATTAPATTTTATAFPSAPRMFGDWAIDGPALSQWFKDVTAANIQQVQTISKLSGGTGDVSANNLPDPATSNVATAQKTANDAYVIATAARTSAARLGMVGSVTISDLATTGDLTFTTAEADTAYFVMASQAAVSGAADAGSLILASIAKTTAKATLTVTVAPGAGTSVTYTVAIMRAPTT